MTGGDAETIAAPGASGVRRSLFLSFAGRYIVILIQLVGTVILARLLTPSDYGVYTIGIVIVNIVSTLRDFGVISYLFQEKNLTESAVQTALGLTLLIGTATAALVALASGAIAAFYHNDGVREVLLVLAVNFIIMPYGAAILALLRREMNFKAALWINVASSLANMLVAVACALASGGFMSLAWGALAASTTSCAVAWRLRPRHFRLVPSLKDWRRLTPFGLFATAGILLSDIGERLPELIIGHLLGVASVGTYGRAAGLIDMFNRLVAGGVAPVAVAAFAQQHRAGHGLSADFRRAIEMMTGIAWPFFAVVALLAFPIVRILFGGNWDAAVPIARYLCVAAAISAIASLNWYVFQAVGAMRGNLWVQAVSQPVAMLLVAAGASFSLPLVGAALIVSAAVFVLVSYRALGRLIGLSLGAVLTILPRALGVTACAALGPSLVALSLTIDADHVWAAFLLGMASAALGWGAGLIALRHPLAEELVRIGASAGSTLRRSWRARGGRVQRVSAPPDP